MRFHRAAILTAIAALAVAGCAAGPGGTAGSVTGSGAATTPGPSAATTSPSQRTESSPPQPTPRFSIDPNYSGFEMIAFGTGGSDCTIETMGRTFAPDDPIRVTAEYSPSLPAGTTVTIRLSMDGVQAAGYPVVVTFETDTRCVFGSVSPGPLPVGHYMLEVAPDSAPAVSGEFDIR